MPAPTAVVVERRVSFRRDSLTDDSWYYIVVSADYSEAALVKDLKDRGYVDIRPAFYSAAWP